MAIKRGCSSLLICVCTDTAGKDHISEHADKTLDIRRGTPVVNVSFGATRDMHIRDKRIRRKELLTRKKQYRKQRISLVHNSAFVMGWQTNMELTHAIPLDKRREGEKREDELMCGGERISITFRDVATYLREDGAIFGQGGVAKDERDLKCAVTTDEVDSKDDSDVTAQISDINLNSVKPDVVADIDAQKHHDSSEPATSSHTDTSTVDEFTCGTNGETRQDNDDYQSPEDVEKAEMLRRFGEENASSTFDWEELYGRGFQILNTKLVQSKRHWKSKAF